MSDIFRRYLNKLKHDKQRGATIVSLFAVGMLLWGRLLLKQVPQTAAAGDEGQAVATDSSLGPVTVDHPVTILTTPEPLRRDLFHLDVSRYKRTLSETSLSNEAKLADETTDEAKQMAVVEAAGKLTLQSVTLGKVPAAFINGRLIKVGGRVEGFELLSCDERSAILVKDGIKVRLRF